MRTAFLVGLVLGGVLFSQGAYAKKKKAGAASATTQAAIEKVLDAQGAAIEACVMNLAIEKGATKVDLDAHLLINNSGQLFDCRMVVTTDKGDKDAVGKCGQKVLRAARYPKSESALISIQRAWHFSMK